MSSFLNKLKLTKQPSDSHHHHTKLTDFKRRLEEKTLHSLGIKEIVSDYITQDDLIDPKVKQALEFHHMMGNVKTTIIAHLNTIHQFHNSCHNLAKATFDPPQSQSQSQSPNPNSYVNSNSDELLAEESLFSAQMNPAPQYYCDALSRFASSSLPKTVDHCIMENCVRLSNQTMELCDIIVEKSKTRHNLVLDYSRNLRLLQQQEEKVSAAPDSPATEDLLRRREKLANSTQAVLASNTELDCIMTTLLDAKDGVIHFIRSGLFAAHKMMGSVLINSLNESESEEKLGAALCQDGLVQFDDLENETGSLRHYETQFNQLKELILKSLEGGFLPPSNASSSASMSSVSTFATNDSAYTTNSRLPTAANNAFYMFNGTNSTFRRPLTTFKGVPLVLKGAIFKLDADALDCVGLFRVAGDSTEVKEMRSALNGFNHDIGENDSLDENTLTSLMLETDKFENYMNIPNIASLLKLFLRELPVSLIPEDVYLEVIKVSERSERAFWKTRIRATTKLTRPIILARSHVSLVLH